MKYANGEEPMVGDVVEALQDQSHVLGGMKTVVSIKTCGSSEDEFVYFEHGDSGWFPWRFRLIHRDASPTTSTFQDRCKDLLPLIQAGAEGKVIQACFPSHAPFPRWIDVSSPVYQFDPARQYRIKPVPKIRPFTAVEAAEHIGRVFTLSPSGIHRWKIVGVEENHVTYQVQDSSPSGRTPFDFLAVSCVFEDDGSPCGVLVEGDSDGQ